MSFKFGVKIALAILSTILSILLTFWISEEWFFDKVYYQKSVLHGYWPPGKELLYIDFGRRGQDISKLLDFIHNPASYPNKIKTTGFTIVIIGDSFVWGQGLRESQRFTTILNKRLNSIRPTSIIQLGSNGDSLLDNYIKYHYAQQLYQHIDLFVIGVFDNDLLLRPQNIYDDDIQKGFTERCNLPLVTEPGLAIITDHDFYMNLIDETFKTSNGNFCIMEYVLSLLPKLNAYYFDFFQQPRTIEPILEEIKYKERFVSKFEPHPSARANAVYADVLYREIVKLPYYSMDK